VEPTRLSRIRAFFAAVHRPVAMPSPARCTTASASSSAPWPSAPATGSHRTSPSAGGRRTSRRTMCPPAVRAGISAEPISPDEPVTTIFIVVSRNFRYSAHNGPVKGFLSHASGETGRRRQPARQRRRPYHRSPTTLVRNSIRGVALRQACSKRSRKPGAQASRCVKRVAVVKLNRFRSSASEWSGA